MIINGRKRTVLQSAVSASNRSGHWKVRRTIRSVPSAITVVRVNTQLPNNNQEDDDDDLICLSSDVDFFRHSPQVENGMNRKVDIISAYIDFELKVRRIIKTIKEKNYESTV